MSDLNELFAELKAEIDERFRQGSPWHENTLNALYNLDEWANQGEFARAEQDAYIG